VWIPDSRFAASGMTNTKKERLVDKPRAAINCRWFGDRGLGRGVGGLSIRGRATSR
jgi:hypothetical protein